MGAPSSSRNEMEKELWKPATGELGGDWGVCAYGQEGAITASNSKSML